MELQNDIKFDYEAYMKLGETQLEEKLYEQAIETFFDVLTYQIENYGSLGIECADAYFAYGKALFMNYTENENPLVLDNLSKNEQQGNLLANGNALPEEESSKKCTEETINHSATDYNNTNVIQEPAPYDQKSTSEDENSDAAADSDLQVAWENLEVARVLLEKAVTFEAKRKLSETILYLGLIEFESGREENSFNEIRLSLDILQRIDEPKDSKLIANINFYLGLVLTYQKKYFDAIQYFVDSRDILTIHLKKYKENISKFSKEIEDLNKTISELDDKIQDCHSCLDPLYCEKGKSIEENPTHNIPNGNVPANDLSHLVKRKTQEDKASHTACCETVKTSNGSSSDLKIKKVDDCL